VVVAEEAIRLCVVLKAYRNLVIRCSTCSEKNSMRKGKECVSRDLHFPGRIARYFLSDQVAVVFSSGLSFLLEFLIVNFV
jgi:hypothetical protein